MREIVKPANSFKGDVFDATVKLNSVKVILRKLTDDYGFSDETAPTCQGVRDWFAKSNRGEGRARQETNSVNWVEDYEYILTMLFVLGDYVYETIETLESLDVQSETLLE